MSRSRTRSRTRPRHPSLRLPRPSRRTLLIALLVLTAAIVGPRTWYAITTGGDSYERVAAIPEARGYRVGIVFGAGLWGDEPTPLLRERIEAGVALYEAGKVDRLLMTGDNQRHDYNEPDVMRATARELGVPDRDIATDYAGRRTYDSCWRADRIFQVDEAVLVTQGFHMPRALQLCQSFGIDSVGYAVDDSMHKLRNRTKWLVREYPAFTRSWLDRALLHPTPVGGDPIPITDDAAIAANRAPRTVR